MLLNIPESTAANINDMVRTRNFTVNCLLQRKKMVVDILYLCKKISLDVTQTFGFKTKFGGSLGDTWRTLVGSLGPRWGRRHKNIYWQTYHDCLFAGICKSLIMSLP
uniref:Uncharacterized protein n=1 Tax=Scleropages formosus TaxID=113540 RepID=A0A8C9QRS6_SCLFO